MAVSISVKIDCSWPRQLTSTKTTEYCHGYIKLPTHDEPTADRMLLGEGTLLWTHLANGTFLATKEQRRGNIFDPLKRFNDWPILARLNEGSLLRHELT